MGALLTLRGVIIPVYQRLSDCTWSSVSSSGPHSSKTDVDGLKRGQRSAIKMVKDEENLTFEERL